MQRPREEDVEGSPAPKRSKGGGKGGKGDRKGKGDGKGGGGGKGGLNNVRRCAFKVLCTDPFAANIIGKSGSTRAQLEEETSCALWMSPREVLFPNPQHRLLILHADEPSQVWAALEKLVPKLIEVAERDREIGEETALIGKGDGEYVFHWILPTLVRGKLLGTRGANIQELRERTNAKIFVENEHYAGHQSARIIGPPDIIANTLSIINDIVQEEAGSDEFREWASTRTFDGVARESGKGDRRERGRDDQDGDRKGGDRGKGDKDGDRRGGDRGKGGKGGGKRRDDRDRSPQHRERQQHWGPPQPPVPTFPEVVGPPMRAMEDLSHEFAQGAMGLDHAISCELPRADVDGLLGVRNEHKNFLQDQTKCTIDLQESDSFCKILITGPLQNTYLTHFMLMKKYHDNRAAPQRQSDQKVEDLKAQLAMLQNQLETVQRGSGGKGRR